MSGLAEYAELRAGLRLSAHDGLIRSAPRTYRASLFPGRDIFENRNAQQRGAGVPASTADLLEIALPTDRPYPTVNRANKGDRLVLRDGTRTVKRVDRRTGRLVRMTLPAQGAAELALRRGSDQPAKSSGVPLPPKVAALAGDDETAQGPDGKETGDPAKQRNRQLMCLAKAVYFEARGEPENGQFAVAQVVMNRVAHPFYPDSICGVVFEDQQRRNKCQFSFACDGRSDRPRNQASWAQAIKVAKKVMHGKRLEAVGESTHYHAAYVHPRWANGMVKVKRIGRHIFYRSQSWS